MGSGLAGLREMRNYESVRELSALPDAAIDYLLFSLGTGRWTPQQGQ